MEVADVGRGLDNEEDKEVREEAETVMRILQRMVEADEPTLAELHEQSEDLLERYNLTMEELKSLADDAKRISDAWRKTPKPRDLNTTEEIEWAAFVEASTPLQEEDGSVTTYEAPDPRAPYDEKSEDSQDKT